MTVHIKRGTLSDISYIAANLRPEDRREIDCQFWDWDATGLAVIALRGIAFTVSVRGNPEAAFGASPTPNPGLWVAWSWGRSGMWRCVPAITEHVRDVLIPMVLEAGAHRCEARCLADNLSAHRWLLRMGARYQGPLYAYGKGGENFKLFEWTRKNVFQPARSIDAADAQADAITAGTDAERRRNPPGQDAAGRKAEHRTAGQLGDDQD